ncbi:MAG: SURF1 family protein [Spongiibacteraceae bacterium]
MGQIAPASRNRSALTLAVLFFALAIAFIGFISLGIWQLQRLAWKVDLIERVEARIHAEPIAPPAKSDWPNISRERDEYRRVRLHGHYLSGRDTRVQAVTELGSGFWILSPLQLTSGDIVLINRGFVPVNWAGDELSTDQQANTETEVIGLLRLSEPDGAFLRTNVPSNGDATNERWYSRDVKAIAAARGLNNVVPYFIDLEASAVDLEATSKDESTWPRAGLTVVNFRNSHLSYALTWFALALLVAWAGWQLWREQRKLHARP